MKKLLVYSIILVLTSLVAFSNIHPVENASPLPVIVFSETTATSVKVTFTAGNPTPEGYIALRETVGETTDSSPPTDSTVYAVGNLIGSNTVVYIGTDTSFNDVGLSAQTEYTYRIYPYTGTGTNTVYSALVEEGNVTSSCMPPVTQNTFNNTTSTRSDNSIILNWTTPLNSGERVIILARETTEVSVSSADQPMIETPYTGNSNFSQAPSLSTSKIVYTGLASPQTTKVTVPNSSATYHFRIYGYQGTTKPCYLLTTPTNAKISFIPTITSLSGETGGVATSPLNAGATNQAILGFSLHNMGANDISFTKAVIQAAVTNSGIDLLRNIRLVSSSNTAYNAENTNLVSATPVLNVTPSTITFENFTNTIQNNSRLYFFVVADVQTSFAASSSSVQLSLSSNSITLSQGTVIGETQTGSAYTFLDATKPTVISITNKQTTISSNSLEQKVEVKFSEPMDSTINPNISFSKGAWTAGPTQKWSDGNSLYTVTYTHQNTSEQISDIQAILSLTPLPKDLSNNTIVTTNIPASNTFTIDTQKPTATILLNDKTSPTTINKDNSELIVKITYDEKMDTNVMPLLSFTPSNNFLRVRSSWDPSGKIYTVTYSHATNIIEEISSNTIKVTGGQDTAGNTQEEKTSPGFSIDTAAPTAQITYDDADGYINGNQSLTITATLSESIQDAPGLQITLYRNAISFIGPVNMTKESSTKYTYTYAESNTVSDGIVNIKLTNAVDLASNLITEIPTSGKSFNIDKTSPQLSILSPPNNSHNIPVDQDLRITLSDVGNILSRAGTIRLYKIVEVGDSLLVESFPITSGTSPLPDKTLILKPTANLEQGTEYYVEIPSGILVDLASNEFSGITEKNWSFTTFAPPQITALRPTIGTSAGCIGKNISIEGRFLTGVTEVIFTGQAENPVSSVTPEVRNDQLIIVEVPATATEGTVKVKKGKINTSNPEVEVTSASSIKIGPSKAEFKTKDNNNNTKYVCNVGNNTTVPVSIEVTGGYGEYRIEYTISAPVNAVQDTIVESQYSTDATINVNPISTGANNDIKLISVKDNNTQCSVPDKQLLGMFTIYENAAPVVDAGGPEVSICIDQVNQRINLDAATLGTPPSSIGNKIKWTTAGGGTFSSPTDISTAYSPSATDLINGGVTLTLASTSAPQGCSNVSDNLVIQFATAPVAYPNGRSGSGSKNHCWDGSTTPVVLLNGDLSGATGYRWATDGDGTFSNSTLQNPSYTFGPDEMTARKAEITLTATDGTACGVAESKPKSLTLLLKTTASRTFLASTPGNTTVCEEMTSRYTLSNIIPETTDASFQWEISPANQLFTPQLNGKQIEIKWNKVSTANSSYNAEIKVTETRDLCVAKAVILNITVHKNSNPTILEPSSRNFRYNEDRVMLRGTGDINTGTEVFSGSGVFTNPQGFFFSPSDAVSERPAGPVSVPITYAYSSAITRCMSTTTEEFTVYDGGRALILRKASDQSRIPINAATGVYNICGNIGDLEIAFDENFLNINPIGRNYQFKAFKIESVEASIDIDAAAMENAIVNRLNTTTSEQPNATLSIDKLTGFNTGDIEIGAWVVENNADKENLRIHGQMTIHVNPLPTLSPNNLSNTNLCAYNGAPTISLTKDPTSNPSQLSTTFSFFEKDTPVPKIITGNTNQGFFINPSLYIFDSPTDFDADTLNIMYTYTNTNGCSDTTFVGEVYVTQQPPKPNINILTDPEKPIQIDNNAQTGNYHICLTQGYIPKDTVINIVKNEKGFASVIWYDNPNVNLNPPRIKEGVFLTPNESGINPNINGVTSFYIVQEINGCKSPVTEIHNEVLSAPAFSWDKFCVDNTENTFYVNLTNAEVSSVEWLIKKLDGSEIARQSNQVTTTPSKQTYGYTFTSPDQYTVDLNFMSRAGCKATHSESVILLKKSIVTETNLYNENFDLGDGGLIAITAPTSKAPSTWQYGQVDKLIIKSLPGDNAWATHLQDPYNNGERSYLYVGCMDISQLDRPVISFSSWVDTDEKNDGVVFQYSSDTKTLNDPTKTWSTLGDINTGLNWYNRQLIQSIPGDNPTENYGWSGNGNFQSDDNSTGWKESKHSLSAIPRTTANNIVFRFAFAATKAQTGKRWDGFAVDNIAIGNRTHIVLIENFVNKGSTNNKISEKRESDYIKNIITNGNIGNIGVDLAIINYHVGFGSENPFSTDNNIDPSSRALYYNISTTPTTRLDGMRPNGEETPFSSWALPEYNKASLRLSSIDISVPTPTYNTEGSLSIDVTLTSKTDFPDGLRLHVAVVEKSVKKSDLTKTIQNLITTKETQFDYLLKKMLPSPSGLNIGSLEQGTSYDFGPFEWTPGSLYGNNNDLAVIVFIQDKNSRIIHQTMYVDDILDPGVTTSINEKQESIAVYPNPADQNIYIALPKQAEYDIPIRMTDQKGIVVLNSVIPKGQKIKLIDTQNMTENIYILMVEPEKGMAIQKKVMISHIKK